MKKIKITPYAKFLRRDELVKLLPRELVVNKVSTVKGDMNDLFGVVIDIKFLDKIGNDKELFLEYTFGKPNKKKKGKK